MNSPDAFGSDSDAVRFAGRSALLQEKTAHVALREPMTTTLHAVTIGVGHLRRQVAFYGSNLGLRVAAKGRVPAAVSRQVWGLDDDLDVVTLARQDLPDALQVRLMRTSDLAARPDFDLTVPGPVGLAFGARDLRRIYYRLSGAGVEFHAGPGEDDADTDLPVYGRAYDGEYVVLQTLDEGSVSPYFGVTEPLEVVLVVRDMEACALFLVGCLEQEPQDQGRVDDEGLCRTMGLPPGAAFHWRTFAAASRSAPRLRLISFGDDQNQQPVSPPSRGLSALRFHVSDLDRALAGAQRAGAKVMVSKTDVAHPAVGTGLTAGLATPLGVRIELWRPRTG